MLNRIPSADPQQAPLTEAAFCAWLGAAAPGDIITYHRGALARDTCPQLNTLPPDERIQLARLSSRVLKLAEAGQVHLIQRRHGFEDYEYVAIARRRPRRNAASIAHLLIRDAA